jgi:hypothetical protein
MIWRSRTRWDAPTKEYEQYERRKQIAATFSAIALFLAGVATGLSLAVLFQ